MRNMMIDDATLNDLQITGFPELVVTDEVLMDIEKRRGKRNVAVQQKTEEERKEGLCTSCKRVQS